jgi:hypothetical protein
MGMCPFCIGLKVWSGKRYMFEKFLNEDLNRVKNKLILVFKSQINKKGEIIMDKNIDPSKNILNLNVKGVFNKLKLIQKELDDNLEYARVRDQNRILKRKKDLIILIEQIDNIKNNKIHIIEEDLNSKFESSELVIISLFQSEMKNLFQELQTFFNKYGSSPNLGNEIYRFDYQEFGENHETKTVQIQ